MRVAFGAFSRYSSPEKTQHIKSTHVYERGRRTKEATSVYSNSTSYTTESLGGATPEKRGYYIVGVQQGLLPVVCAVAFHLVRWE